MQTKISKLTNTFCSEINPEQITKQLIKTLEELLLSKNYLNYKTTYTVDCDCKHELNMEAQLEFIFGKPTDENMTRNIRIASETWNSLSFIDRLIVLDAFSTLYLAALIDYNALQKTVLFCQIFINDFIEILTSQ